MSNDHQSTANISSEGEEDKIRKIATELLQKVRESELSKSKSSNDQKIKSLIQEALRSGDF
jgi:hypothetical protein